MAAADNVIHLPRPEGLRDPSTELGLYIRIGRNDHLTMLDLLAEGEKRIFGVVIDAQHTHRHRELRAETLKRGFDVILDPKTHPLAMVGGHTHTLSGLPWAEDRPHRLQDFDGSDGIVRAAKVAEFAIKNDFTQLLGPTHFLQNHTDPWLAHDIRMMEKTRQFLDQESSDIELIYPLSLPIDVLRTPAYRRAVIAALKDAPFDALWLKVDNFGGDASGDKTIAYIEACRDFHALGVPIVSDHVGGLPALGLMAFSAVGGICHGVTLAERFNSYSWRKPQLGNSGRTPQVRVYIERLDAHLKPDEAKAFLNASSRVKGRFGCTDTHCCNGVQGQLARPARHYIHQRSREVTELSNTPASIRVQSYLDKTVRKVSDDVAAVAGFGSVSDELKKKFAKKNKSIGTFRKAMANMAEADRLESVAQVPERREARRKTKKQ
ncbi:MAG: hypothetical protein AAFO98_01855 [Pseudomonadota bacterium]